MSIIIGILISIIIYMGMYGVLIKTNWNNDRYLYVKNDNKNIIGIFLRGFTFFVIITLMILVNPSILGIIFSGMIIILYVKAPKIIKKRMVILCEVIFTTFIFNTLYVIISTTAVLAFLGYVQFEITTLVYVCFYITMYLFILYIINLLYIRTRRFFTVENNFLKKYSKYYEGEKKEKFIAKIYNNLSDEEKKDFFKNYCKIYENKEEYKNDKFNSINYKYFPIILIILLFLFIIVGLLLGGYQISVNEMTVYVNYESISTKIIAYTSLTMILMYSLGALLVQSYLYNLGNSKIKNIRIKNMFRIEKNCHPIFNKVHSYRNFEDFMLDKEMTKKPLGIRKFLFPIIIGIVFIYLYKISIFLINIFSVGIFLW